MDRRRFLIWLLVIGVLAGIGWLGFRRDRRSHEPRDTGFDRILFVCVDEHGQYSPGVYLHGAEGDAAQWLDMVRQAAPYMSRPETGDAAAGLCGFLFKRCGDDAARGGGLSLYDAPKPQPSGSVDWQAYCGWNVDLVLINVERGTAEVFSSPANSETQPKVVIARASGLRFGR